MDTKGNRIELSGTEAYSGIMMPMMSAMEHFEKSSMSQDTRPPRPVFIVLAVAVVDAPMIAYDINRKEDKLEFVSCHRVIRNEPDEKEDGFSAGASSHMGSQSAVDIVHKDFLGTYMTEYVRPFARNIADLMLRHHKKFASGSMFVNGYGADRTSDIWGRIRSDD